MFASPESRAKKEAKKSVASQEASAENQVGIANNKNVEKLNSLQGKSNNLVENSPLNSLQQKANKNNTGLPDNLKFGVESLSGISLDDVKVNYNSDKTSSLGAHGYAQGNQIHLEGGQEKHLAHEAWHVVQQKQGRVNSTKEVNGKRINDDSLLEKEATNMGNKANAFSAENIGNKLISSKPFKSSSNNVAQLFKNPFSKKKYGEYKDEEQKKQDKGEGGFLKGATRGVLGLGGGILGGLGGLAKGIGHKAYNKATGGEDISIMDNMKAGGTAGRDAGRAAGSAIVDGTRAIAGGAVGAAGGVIGGLGGATYGAGKKAYNKATGGEDVSIMDNMMGGAKGGAKMGYEKTNSLIDIAEEVPGLGVDMTRGALGAAGGVVGGLGGAVYGTGKKAFNKVTGGKDVSITKNMMKGAKGGFNIAANSEGSKMAMKSGVAAAAGLAAAPTGGGFAAAALAAKGMETYYGGTETEGDLAMAKSLAGGSLGGLAGGAAGAAEASLNGGSNFLSNLAASKGTSTAVSMATGMGIDKTHKYVDQYGEPNDDVEKIPEPEPEEQSFGEKAKSFGNKAKNGLKASAGTLAGGIGGLLGGLGGAAYGTGKKAYNKVTGGEDVSVMDSMLGGAKMVDNKFGGYAGKATESTGAEAGKTLRKYTKTDENEENHVGNKLIARKNRIKNIIFGKKTV
jgi:hypothetical protein